MENFKAEICQKHCFFNDEQADRWTEGRTERPTNGRTRHHHHWAVSTVMASVPNWKQSESCGELKWKRLEKTHSSNGINYKSLSLNRMKITKTEKKKKKPLAWLFVSHHCPSHRIIIVVIIIINKYATTLTWTRTRKFVVAGWVAYEIITWRGAGRNEERLFGCV